MNRIKSLFFLPLLVLISISIGCSNKTNENATPNADSIAAIDTAKQPASKKTVKQLSFEGEYISPQPEKIDKGTYFTDVIISKTEQSNTLQIVFSSAKIKKQTCCSFTGIGYEKHDTLFVRLPQQDNTFKNPMMIITHIPGNGTTNGVLVGTADTTDNNVLMNFCCSGASLSGSYYPCDLSQFKTDTVKANSNTNLP